ncbi:hypothetical protein [Streptomyces sp. Ru73]|uniref:hypothetical protein n=1 Tax=Streptomyces sp. Ru73 TaxID=2080748 RepID=UPI0015E349AA|nr:hypothetical protein [Streptomyces sp. Ru73]
MRDYIETAELADSELDGIAAGAAVVGGSVAGYDAAVTIDGTAVQAVEGVAQGAIAKANGLGSALPTAGL